MRATFLFTDVEGSTRLWEADREGMAASLEVHDHIMRKAIDVQRWVSHLQDDGYAPSTVRKAHQLLSRQFASAVDNQLLLSSPCANTRLPKPHHQEMRFLTFDELMLLGDAIDARFRTLIVTAGTTGLRFGELAALSPTDVGLERRTLTVTKTLSEVRGVVNVSAPKTKASRRTLTLPAFLIAELTWHMSRHTGTSDFLFPAPLGGPLRRSTFRRRFWLPAVRDSVRGDLRFHDLRHTAVALLISQGVHAKMIQARMGHASIRTTLDRYGHLFDTLDAAAADALDGLFEAANRAQEGTKWGPTGPVHSKQEPEKMAIAYTPQRVSEVGATGFEPVTSAV